MSGRAKGNVRESSVAARLDALGYGVVSVKGSGARGAAMRRRNHAVVGDLLAIPVASIYPFWLQVSVGSHAPGQAFAEFDANLLPGFRVLCVLYAKRAKKRVRGKAVGLSKVATARYYIDPHTFYASLTAALEEMRER